MTRLQKTILSIFFLIVVGLFALVIWLYMGAWQKPLGPSLQLPTPTPFQMPATWTPDPNATGTPLFTPLPVSTKEVISQPTSAPVTGMCGAPPMMNILVIGTDARGDNYTYGLADVIRLVRVDFVNPKVSVLEIPRDLWVEIPDIVDNLN